MEAVTRTRALAAGGLALAALVACCARAPEAV
jgi:hypothetical protein